MDNALPFGVDAAFQLYTDWHNPYLSPVDRLGRSGFAGLIGFGGGAAAKGIATLIAGSNPPGLLVFGIGVGIGLTAEAWLNDTVNEFIFPGRSLMLRPLE